MSHLSNTAMVCSIGELAPGPGAADGAGAMAGAAGGGGGGPPVPDPGPGAMAGVLEAVRAGHSRA